MRHRKELACIFILFLFLGRVGRAFTYVLYFILNLMGVCFNEFQNSFEAKTFIVVYSFSKNPLLNRIL